MNAFAPHVPPALTRAQAATISALAMRASGVKVSPDKLDFIRTRLGRRLREINCDDFDDYLALIDGPTGAAELSQMIESLTTHTTSFFRESAHYDWLEKTGLPELTARGTGIYGKLSVWSAACSIGAEMWSAAIVIDRYAQASGQTLHYDLTGTDISRRILRRAAGATFTEAEIAGLPQPMRAAYLLRSTPQAGGQVYFRIVPNLRSRARLAYANLLDLDNGPVIAADVIFLRNVLIYFTPSDQERVVAAVIARLRPGGYLLTGHTESLPSGTAGLRQHGASIYQRS